MQYDTENPAHEKFMRMKIIKNEGGYILYSRVVGREERAWFGYSILSFPPAGGPAPAIRIKAPAMMPPSPTPPHG